MDAPTGPPPTTVNAPPAERDALQPHVLQMVQTLSLEERHVLMLHYGEGLEPLEISLVLDLPVPSVERMLDDLRSMVAREVRLAG